MAPHTQCLFFHNLHDINEQSLELGQTYHYHIFSLNYSILELGTRENVEANLTNGPEHTSETANILILWVTRCACTASVALRKAIFLGNITKFLFDLYCSTGHSSAAFCTHISISSRNSSTIFLDASIKA